MRVARLAGDVQRLAAIVTLDQGDHLRRPSSIVHKPAYAQRRLQSERDLRLHVCELFLHELRCGERPAELLAVECVVARAPPAILRRAHCAPRNSVARSIKTAEWALK